MPLTTPTYQNYLMRPVDNTTDEKKIIKNALEIIRSEDIHQLDGSDPDHQEKFQIFHTLMAIVFETLDCDNLRNASRAVISEIDLEVDLESEKLTDDISHLLHLARPELKYSERKTPVPDALTVLPEKYLNYLAFKDFDQKGEFTGFLVTRVLFYQKSPQELMNCYGLKLCHNFTGKSLKELKKERPKGYERINSQSHKINTHGDYYVCMITPINIDQPDMMTNSLSCQGYINQKLMEESGESHQMKFKTILYESWIIQYNKNAMYVAENWRNSFDMLIF